MTGRPRSLGSSRCSTDAKNESASAWRIVARDATNVCSQKSAPELTLELVHVPSGLRVLGDQDVAVAGDGGGGERKGILARGAGPERTAHPVPVAAVRAGERDRKRDRQVAGSSQRVEAVRR